jgi:hypothetical protein
MATFKLQVDRTLGCGNHNLLCPKVCSFKVDANCPHYELLFKEHFMHTHCQFVERKVVARPTEKPVKGYSPFRRVFKGTDMQRNRVNSAQWIACSSYHATNKRMGWKNIYPYLKVKNVSKPDSPVTFVCCYCQRVSKCAEMIKDHIARCHLNFLVEGVEKRSPCGKPNMITRGSLAALLFDD